MLWRHIPHQDGSGGYFYTEERIKWKKKKKKSKTNLFFKIYFIYSWIEYIFQNIDNIYTELRLQKHFSSQPVNAVFDKRQLYEIFHLSHLRLRIRCIPSNSNAVRAATTYLRSHTGVKSIFQCA